MNFFRRFFGIPADVKLEPADDFEPTDDDQPTRDTLVEAGLLLAETTPDRSGVADPPLVGSLADRRRRSL